MESLKRLLQTYHTAVENSNSLPKTGDLTSLQVLHIHNPDKENTQKKRQIPSLVFLSTPVTGMSYTSTQLLINKTACMKIPTPPNLA